MSIETGGIITLVAGSSVLAALVTQGVAAIRDSRKTKKDAGFAALYLAIALESYASECASALGESETYEASGGHAGAPRSDVPDLPDYPSSVEWKPFGLERTSQTLSFRVEVETAKAMLSDHWNTIGDEDVVVPLAREETAKLGTKAVNLAIAFRKEWKIAPVDYGDDWNVRSYLEERSASYAEGRKKQEERDRKLHEGFIAGMDAAKLEPDGG